MLKGLIKTWVTGIRIIAVLIVFSVSVHAQGDCKPSPGKNKVYQVALMIPLYLEQLADTNWQSYLDPSKINDLSPFRFIQYYHGFMLAADSLRKQGMKIEISVYDVDHQQAKLDAVLRKPELKKMDLIVGPFFKIGFSEVAKFALEHKIPIINPLSSRSDILDGNPYVFKLLPSVESQAAIVGGLVRRDYSSYNVMLYIANQFQGINQASRLKEAIERGEGHSGPEVTMIDWASDSIQGFKVHASHTRPNLVIIYAENEVLPSALLSKLSAFREEYALEVIGLPEWEKFNNIETAYLIALKANVLVPAYVDPRSEPTRNMILSYRSKYYDEPLSYAFSGFDAGYFFLSALMNFGKDFESCIHQIPVTLTQNQFYFEKIDGGGYDNVNWNVLQYLDYSLLKKSYY